jgi:hypothetical protein
MRYKRAFSLSIGFCCLLLLRATSKGETVPFDDLTRWDIRATEAKVIDYLGRKALYLKGGLAVVKDSKFTDGVVEFDLAVTGERGFVGAVWRLQDFDNFEEFYIRPHQSGNPDANQYQPVFHGVAAWQLYYGDGYGAPVKYDFNQWMHIKIVVSGSNAEVYIKDLSSPALFVSQLRRELRAGHVGLNVGNFAPGYYSNFSFTSVSTPVLKGKPKPAAVRPVGTVLSWQVSAAFDESLLEKKYELLPSDKENLHWTKLSSEPDGLTNLAIVQGVEQKKNTVFAKIVIQSEREQIKKVRFGFSDKVKLYFNDRLLYGGSDLYLSRDYRFLGTMGLFDEVYLPLRAGKNELCFAVTENFGGWGVRAMFEDQSGIRIEN